MQKVFCALSLLACSVGTQAQTVTDQSAGMLMYAIDSEGEEVVGPFLNLDPTLAPVSVSEFVENDEPLSFFAPTYHTASLDANIDSTGSNWTGSGNATAHYADALDLSQDYGGSNIPAASAFFTHTIDFSVAYPTTVDVNADFLIEMTDPFNPVLLVNNFEIQFRDNSNNTIYSTGFDNSMLGVAQQRSDSFVLAPGDYTFRLNVDLNTQEQLGFRDGSIDFAYDVSFVPAPASATLLMGGLVLGIRRRR